MPAESAGSAATPLTLAVQIPRRWLKVGVEMEGGWTSRNPAERLPVDDEDEDADEEAPRTGSRYRRGLAFHYDGSVHVDHANEGEIVTEPCDSLERLWSLMDRGHPEHVNNSCGMHVHVSFSRGDYSRLLDDEFIRYFRSAWDTILRGLCPLSELDRQRLEYRLSGRNRFAQLNNEFDRMEQVRTRGKGGPRYQQLNYCYSHLGTIECRVLPAFESAAAAKWAVGCLLDIYDAYLFLPDENGEIGCVALPEPEAPLTESHESEFILETLAASEECEVDLHPELTRKPKRGTIQLLDVGKSDSVRKRFQAMVRAFQYAEGE